MRLLILLGLLTSLTSLALAQPTMSPLLMKLDCPDRVLDVAYSPDGKLLAAGFGWSVQGGARIWNAADFKLIADLKTGEPRVERIAFSPDGKLFAAANSDGDVMLWNVGSWKSFRTILNKRGSAEALAFSPDSTKLAFASRDTVIVYDLRSGEQITLITEKELHNSFVSVSFSRRARSLFAFHHSSVEEWDVEKRKQIRVWKAADYGFFGDVSRDGTLLISGGGAVFRSKAVELWNATNGTKLGEITAFRNGLFGLAISHSSQLFAVTGGTYGDDGGYVSLWSVNSQDLGLFGRFPFNSSTLNDLDFSARYQPQEIAYVSFGDSPLYNLTFSPDDTQLAVASEDGFVLLYAVDRIRGPEVKKQDRTLCGEILTEAGKVFIVPLSKVPVPMGEFEYAWKLEIVNSKPVEELIGLPVILNDWSIVSSADRDRISINQFSRVLPEQSAKHNLDHILYGDIQNPGWNEGLLAKIYQDGTFVVTNNPGECLAHGKLDQLKTNFETVRSRLIVRGFLSVPIGQLVIGTDHYRTQFMELRVNGVSNLRSDADSFSTLISGKSTKREAFSRIYEQEESFINSLRNSGMKRPSN